MGDAAGTATEKIFDFVSDKITGGNNPGPNPNPNNNQQWDEGMLDKNLFTVGASVNIVNSKNTADITVGDTADISGESGISVDSQAILKGMTLAANSTVKASNDGGATVSAGVLVSKRLPLRPLPINRRLISVKMPS